MRKCYQKAIEGIIRDNGGASRRLLNKSYLIGNFMHDGRCFGYWIDLASRYQEITLDGRRITDRLNDTDNARTARARIIDNANRLIRASIS